MAALLVLLLLSCGNNPVFRNGDVEVEIAKAEWNKIHAGPFEIEGGGLVLGLKVRRLGDGEPPQLKLSARTSSGAVVEQGTTVTRRKGETAHVETFFLIQKTKEPVDLLIEGFDPIPLSPIDKLK